MAAGGIPALEARWILEFVAGSDPRVVRAEDLSPSLSNKYTELVELRKTGLPLAYVLGQWEFYGYTFAVRKGVLIPRPETELLVDRALLWLQEQPRTESFQILDLGSGSGCLGISVLLKARERGYMCRLVTIDRFDEPIKVTRENVKSFGLNDVVEVFQMDVLEAFSELEKNTQSRFQIVLANPPYVAPHDMAVDAWVRLYEPHEALFATDNGTALVKSWSKEIIRVLDPQRSITLFEIGHDQGANGLQWFKDLGSFSRCELLQDLSGHDRILSGICEDT
jgi:release factor glutamine methyltransferase